MNRRRVLFLLGVFVLLVFVYSGWRVWQVQRDLAAAEDSATDFIAAIDSDDPVARADAVERLGRHAEDAREGTDGVWWGAYTHLPLVGDDAAGVRALSRSLEHVSAGAKPVADTLGDLDEVTGNGRINLKAVGSLQEPVSQASTSFAKARDEVDGLDSSGYVGSFRARFDDYVERISEAASNLTVADKAIQVLPTMAGSDGPRTYLFVFQNNAEIRATGGLPGSWSEVRAEGGKIEIVRQGAGSDFPVREKAPTPLTQEERAVYGDAMGQYFLDSNFTPDFPRAAELFRAHYEKRFPDSELDGVLTLDPVSVSYLLKGTGSITVDEVTLTSENAIDQLLSEPYKSLSPLQQDAFFRNVAKALFSALTGDVASPRALVEAVSRAGREGRFLVAPFDPRIAEDLAGSEVLGEMTIEDDATPQVDVALNDATGSKMSYYLRYRATAESVACRSGRQEIEGRVTLSQAIRPSEARKLPDVVTGGGQFGTTRGEQTVIVRIYGPHGAEMSDLRIDGALEDNQTTMTIAGRPVYVLAMGVRSSIDTVVSWKMRTLEGQEASGLVGVTPGVVPGTESSRFGSSCR